MEKPYDIKTAYTNEFLDKNIKMPPINPPKLTDCVMPGLVPGIHVSRYSRRGWPGRARPAFHV